MEDLFNVITNLPEPFITPQDKYRAFRKVFMDSDEGKQVLREILSWCHLLKPSVMGSPIDSNAVMVLEGERNLGLRLIMSLTVEPQDKLMKVKR